MLRIAIHSQESAAELLQTIEVKVSEHRQPRDKNRTK